MSRHEECLGQGLFGHKLHKPPIIMVFCKLSSRPADSLQLQTGESLRMHIWSPLGAFSLLQGSHRGCTDRRKKVCRAGESVSPCEASPFYPRRSKPNPPVLLESLEFLLALLRQTGVEPKKGPSGAGGRDCNAWSGCSCRAFPPGVTGPLPSRGI